MKTILVMALALVAGAAYSQKVIGSKAFGTIATVTPNAEYKGHSYKKILISSGLDSKKSEAKVVKEFWDIGVPAVGALEILDPGKKYTPEELKAIYAKNEIDGVITITKDEAASTSMQAILDLTLFDVEKSITAVTYKGKASLGAYSAVMASDKIIVKFARLVVDDIKPYVGK